MLMIPLISHDHQAGVFAYCKGQPVSVAQYLSDVHRLAARLPDRAHVLNLCADRYRFTVGFAAALLRRQISLLPPNYTNSFVARLQHTYPELYCLTDEDTQFEDVAVVRYPDLPRLDAEQFDIPLIPAAQPAALIFTSGSTGLPVAHLKSWRSLCRGAAAAATRLGVEQGMAVLGTVPAQHMYGMESCMLMAMQNGLILVAERPYYPLDICEQLAALPKPRCLITTPLHLHYLLAEMTVVPEVVFVLSSTAPLSQQLASKAEACFAAPVHEIYGCTEAGMVASRRTAQGMVWQLMPDVSLRQDEASSLVSGGHIEIEARLGDEIEMMPDRQFLLHGRMADMVNMAGKRTSLASLNFYLNDIPGVTDGVFVLPDENTARAGHLLAFVVAPNLQRDDILSALRLKVDAVFLPRPLYFIDILPRNATGKLTAESLRQLMLECQ
jgi:acyl-coenzyme A synthetase/AMP-(fatty) acid ligase